MKRIRMLACSILLYVPVYAMYKIPVIWPKDVHKDPISCIDFLEEHGLKDAFIAMRTQVHRKGVKIIVTESAVTCRPATPVNHSCSRKK